jgi:hypothetical protein
VAISERGQEGGRIEVGGEKGSTREGFGEREVENISLDVRVRVIVVVVGAAKLRVREEEGSNQLIGTFCIGGDRGAHT